MNLQDALMRVLRFVNFESLKALWRKFKLIYFHYFDHNLNPLPIISSKALFEGNRSTSLKIRTPKRPLPKTSHCTTLGKVVIKNKTKEES